MYMIPCYCCFLVDALRVHFNYERFVYVRWSGNDLRQVVILVLFNRFLIKTNRFKER